MWKLDEYVKSEYLVSVVAKQAPVGPFIAGGLVICIDINRPVIMISFLAFRPYVRAQFCGKWKISGDLS